MLPDLPDIKQELLEVQLKFFEWARQEEMGAFKSCKASIMFEGHQHGVERPTGESEVNPFWEISTEIEIKPQEEDLGSSFAKIYEMGRQLAKQIERNSFQYLDKTLGEHGQVIDAKGRNMVDAIFEMFEKIEIPLGADGKLDRSNLQIVCGSGMIEALKKMEQSKELTDKFEALMTRKETEARAREANRKLAG